MIKLENRKWVWNKKRNFSSKELKPVLGYREYLGIQKYSLWIEDYTMKIISLRCLCSLIYSHKPTFKEWAKLTDHLYFIWIQSIKIFSNKLKCNHKNFNEQWLIFIFQSTQHLSNWFKFILVNSNYVSRLNVIRS